jgi:hypothetical protein
MNSSSSDIQNNPNSSIMNEEEDEDEDEDDPFSMAVKELSETNRRANEIVQVRISSKYFQLNLIKNISATFNTITTNSYTNTS